MDFDTLLFLITLFLTFVSAGIALAPGRETASIGKRLQGLQASQVRVSASLRDRDEMGKSPFERIVLPLMDNLSKRIGSLLPNKTMEKIQVHIVQAGLVGKIRPEQIMTMSYVLAIALPIAPLLLMNFPTSILDYSTMAIVFAALLGWRLPQGMVQSRATERKAKIQRALPFTLDLISISVEGGMGLDGAIAIVTEKSSGPLADELRQTLAEMRLGKSRNEALTDLGERLGVDDLKSFITAVTYIARLGGSLVDVIRIQSEAMRVKRRQRAEEKAMQTPVKIMFPLVFFIFPAMFVVILAPAALTMMKQFGQMPH